MNMCLLEVAMCAKCRSSHFQSEGGSKKFEDLGGLKNFWTGGRVTDLGLLLWGSSVPHYMPCLLPLLMSAFFAKNQRFLAKMVPLLKAVV